MAKAFNYSAVKVTHQMSLWSVLIGALIVALATAVTVHVLRQNARESHRSYDLISFLEDRTNLLSALEWEVIAEQKITPAKAKEAQKIRDQIRRTIHELAQVKPGERELQEIFAIYLAYESALEDEFRLIANDQIDRARALDREKIDPDFKKLSKLLNGIKVKYSIRSEEEDRSTFLTSIFIFVTAAFLIGFLFWRFQRAGQKLELMASEYKANEQLRNLSAHLQTVREEERSSISREIHDELGQVLTALKMDLSWLSTKHGDDEGFLKKTRSMGKLIDSTIQTVKRISAELRPVLLDDLGLTAAIQWEAGQFQQRTGITCTVSCSPEDVILDRDRSIAIFRIFQEALTNVARHAEATRVNVYLEEKGGRVMLDIQDNGKGITEDQIVSPQSLGLIGMRERVYHFGGNYTLVGIPKSGTSLTVMLPTNQAL